MKLFYWRHPDGIPNFGDELNPWIFSRLAPDLFQREDDGLVLVGMGTILNDRLEEKIRRRHGDFHRIVVFGSGVGHHGGPPILDSTLQIVCVRGPRSTEALGLPAHMAVTDPGCLVSHYAGQAAPVTRFSLMPHMLSVNESWEEAARSLGFGFIDPRWPVERVINAIQATQILLTEAMHGAIVADALRVPWIHVVMSPPSLESGWRNFKWDDWCQSLELTDRQHHLFRLYPRPHEGRRLLSRARHGLKTELNRLRLRQIVRTARPILSRDQVLADRTEQLLERLEDLRRDYRSGNL